MRAITKMLAALAIGAAIGGAAVAGPLEDSLAAHKRGELAEAFRLMRIAAEAGNANAQTNVGVMYLAGEGVIADTGQAVNWFRRAAAQGDGVGQFYLGEAYRLGEGVSVDDAEALRWYRLSAKAPKHPVSSKAAFMAAAMEIQIDLNQSPRPR